MCAESGNVFCTVAVCCLLFRGKHGGKHIMTGTVHRVAIYDSMFRLMHIISQTDIIK